jgi:hypothetical protein
MASFRENVLKEEDSFFSQFIEGVTEKRMTNGKKGSKHNALIHGIFAGILLSGPEAEDASE